MCDHPGPTRTCAGCGKRDKRSALLRVVTNSDGHLTVDTRRVQPGRGAWVHPTHACITQAHKRRSLPRILKLRGPAADTAVTDTFWEELTNAALSEAPRVPERE